MDITNNIPGRFLDSGTPVAPPQTDILTSRAPRFSGANSNPPPPRISNTGIGQNQWIFNGFAMDFQDCQGFFEIFENHDFVGPRGRHRRPKVPKHFRNAISVVHTDFYSDWRAENRFLVRSPKRHCFLQKNYIFQCQLRD